MLQVDKVHFFPVLVWVIILFLIWYMIVIVNIIPKYYKVFRIWVFLKNVLYKNIKIIKYLNKKFNKKNIEIRINKNYYTKKKSRKIIKRFYRISNINLGRFDIIKQNIRNRTINIRRNNIIQRTRKSYIIKYITENYWNIKNQFYINVLKNNNNKVWLLNFNNKSLKETVYYKNLLKKGKIDQNCFEKAIVHPICTWVQQLNNDIYYIIGWNITHNKK